MKLIYVHTGKFPSNSPSMTFVLYNAIALSNVTDKTYLFLKKNSSKDVNKILLEHFSLKPADNLSIILIQKIFNLKSNLLFFIQVYLRINNILKKEKIDAVITRNTKFLPWLVKLKKHNVKLFYETHDFYADLSLRNDLKKNNYLLLEKIEKKFIPKLNGVFCLQNEQMMLYKKAIKNYDNYFLARTGINKIYFSEFNNRKYISYIGSFDMHKGILDLLETFSEVEINLPLLLIGGKTTNEIMKINEVVKSLKLDGRIKITGWVNKDKVYELLQQTILGIVPLKPDFFNKYLTSPLKIFDYFSCGIPILASDLPSIRELIKENETGFFYEAGNANNLKAKFIEAVSDRARLKIMSNNIYNCARNYLWEERAKLILNIIDET